MPAVAQRLLDLAGHAGVDVGQRRAEGLPGVLLRQDQELTAAQRLLDVDAVLGQPAQQGVRGAVVVEVEDPLTEVEAVRHEPGPDLAEVLEAVRDRTHVIAGREIVRKLDHDSPAVTCAPG